MEDIQNIVLELEDENNRIIASDPGIQKSMSLVEAFLKTHPVMCYGGTAINNLLPVKDRFYNPETDVPDYDFFSKTPQEHSVILSNQLIKSGLKNVEVKPGMHIGTFKVFADFTAVADITHLTEEVFDRLWEDSLVREGIHYVNPNFLRMSMYLELSRPKGDVSRWEKVYKRLQLLNQAHPVTCPKDKIKEHEILTTKQRTQIENLLKNEPVVLLGVGASEIHMRTNWTTPIALLANKDVIERLTKGEDIVVDEENEILPRRTTVLSNGEKHFIRFYETSACHSYHTMKNGIRVASIPTTLQFFFAYLYSGGKSENIASILCIAQRLVEIANEKTSRRFVVLTPKECLGKQETFTEMKREKANLYSELSSNKSSPEFLEYFFSYNPSDSSEKRKQLIKALRKTRKNRAKLSSETKESS
jgi:hypothetical protein